MSQPSQLVETAHVRDPSGCEVPDAPICPLCRGTRHSRLDMVSYDDVRHVYRRILGVDIPAGECSKLEYVQCLACDLRFFWPQICGDSGFYEKLQVFPWYYLAEKTEYRMASRLIPAGSAVLEIGCGAGLFAGFLPGHCSYQGLEYNSEAIRKARERGLTVELASIEDFSRSREPQFDVVCSFQVLEHVPSPGTFLAAAARVLRPGGMLIIAVPSESSFMADEVNNVLNMPPHHVTRWTDAALESVARVIGMQLVHLEHEVVSDLHLRPFVDTQVWQFARHKLGIRVPMVSRRASSLWARRALRLLTLPLEKYARTRSQRPFGHSVVAAYKKV